MNQTARMTTKDNCTTVGRQAVEQQLAALTNQERHRLISILALLIGADEALADIHLCLPSVALDFYLFDASAVYKATYTPRELLRMLQESLHDQLMEDGADLMLD